MKRTIWAIAALPTLAALTAASLPALAADGTSGPINDPSLPAPLVSGPWGDVNGDGRVTPADADLVQTYITAPSTLSLAQRERIRRYGDVNGVVNRNTVGNGTVDGNDTQRAVLLGSGMIDAGTAGLAPAGYGDVNGDGRCDIVDATLIHRAQLGKVPNATIDAAIHSRGGGDISPTIPYISFGDGVIDAKDVTLIQQRAAGTEANPPAYTDFWPLHAANTDNPDVIADRYTFTDITLTSGDAMNQVTYVTQTPTEVRGYTVTEVKGTDNSLAGVFKGQDGSIYAMWLKYPQAFGNTLVTFQSPVKVLDARAVRGGATAWTGETESNSTALGPRPTKYAGTVLSTSDVYTPAAGLYPDGTPRSMWSQTVRVRLDVEVLAGPLSQVEMQQAFFFDFTPFIGMVQRGQASLVGSPEPTLDRPYLQLDQVTVRGRTYRQTAP